MKKRYVRGIGIVMLYMMVAAGCSKDAEDVLTQQSVQANSEGIGQNIDPDLIGKTFASEDYEYTVQENGTIYISGYIGNATEITLPLEIDGYTVTGIAEVAFMGNQNLQSLHVPGQIKEIGERAFRDCSNLKYLEIEEGVTSIGRMAFYGCKNIDELDMADSVYKVGESAFPSYLATEDEGLLYIGNVVYGFAGYYDGYEDSFSGHIVFREGTLGIADEALKFYGTGGEILDETVQLPDGLLYIGSAAFLNQNKIYNFRVPASVLEIGPYALHAKEVNFDYEYRDLSNCKIYGYAESVAEEYAKGKFQFVIIND